jgi:hypothetical protein
MDAGWMCMVVLTIRPSLSSERGLPRYPKEGRLQNPPVWDIRDHEENRSIIRAENQIPTILSELTTAPVC